MIRCRLPDGPRIETKVEKYDQGGTPVPTNWKWVAPTSWTFHLMGRKVQRVDLRLRQVMPTCYVALRLGFGNLRDRVDEALFSRPRHDRPQMFACLVRGAPRICPSGGGRMVIDSIKKLSDLLPPESFNRNSASPLRPFLDSRGILVSGSTCGFPVVEEFRHRCFESRWHLLNSSTASACSNARSSRPAVASYASCCSSHPVRIAKRETNRIEGNPT